ncbi:DUF952 domain-containing protein [Crossiella sp. CA198]|uniref:DUF952 domain-containing protein n=1 Tax=Crossiella sp. CA198 TaxID=3455607 RepID=UPI003F8D503F
MILHICSHADWAAAQESGRHEPEGYAAEGFVHCSDFGLVHLPANRLFRGRDDLVLLVVAPDLLDAELVWERASSDPDNPSAPWFPHVYGTIPVSAVIAVHDFPEQPHGFELPAALRRWPIARTHTRTATRAES